MGSVDWLALLPTIAVAAGALLVLLIEALFAARADADAGVRSAPGRRLDLVLASLATLAVGIAIATSLFALAGSAAAPGAGAAVALRLDGLASASTAITGLAAWLAIWLSSTYRAALRVEQGEYWALMLLALSGAFLAFAARNLLLLYLGLELLQLPIYALVALEGRRLRGAQTAQRFFLAGAFASAVLLYGMALLYGAAGGLGYADLEPALVAGDPLALAGLALLLAGLGFKLAWVPFHNWLPAVCGRAATPIASFVCTCVQGSGLLVVLRLVLEVMGGLTQQARPLFAILAVLGILVGSLMAVIEANVKRLLAWVGVAHAGELTLALMLGSRDAGAALLFYLLAQSLAICGAFAVLTAMAARGREPDTIGDFAGLARNRPGLAAAMTLFVFSLAGLPLTLGFWARLHLFSGLAAAGEIALLMVALAGAVVLLGACLRLPLEMYMREAPARAPSGPSTSELVVLFVCASSLLYFGLFPEQPLPGFGQDLLSLLRGALVR